MCSPLSISPNHSPAITLFSDLNFQIQRGEKVAVIGDNGTGKTTILKIINGLEQADHGSVTTRQQGAHQLLRPGAPAAAYGKDTVGGNFGRLPGDDRHPRFATCWQPFFLPGMMCSSAFKDLSGGERGRLSLAQSHALQVQFSDSWTSRPTTWTSPPRRSWKKRSNSYTGTVLYVSHDRYFINQTATRILELKDQTLVNYIGNYDYYLEKV